MNDHGSPLAHSPHLARRIRSDDLDTLGTSTLTLFEGAARSGQHELAAELLEYFWEEMLRIGEALFIWMEDIVAYRIERDVAVVETGVPQTILRGIRAFEPSEGDRNRALDRLAAGDPGGAIQAAELGRVRYAALHDAYVVWIQQLLTDIADDFGETAVKDVVVRAYERLWKQRYAVWWEMTPLQRLQLSVEGMRGHLSGPGRRGDVGVVDEGDRYRMILDPCGSCGILRRGDPESGRPPCDPSGNQEPQPWTWFQTGKSWYSLHSPIVMEWLDMREGRPPFRPLESCDEDSPCSWFIYKEPGATRPDHYARMGFTPSVAGGREALSWSPLPETNGETQ